MALIYKHLSEFQAYAHLLLLALVLPYEALGQCASPGTTSGIRDIVLGRCLEYQGLVNQGQYCNSGVGKNCSEIASLFISAFAFQPTCNVSLSRYDDYLQAAHLDPPQDQALFWSDVYGVAQRYSERGRRATPIEDTLIGYIADRLHFCAEETGQGIKYDSECAGFDQTDACPANAEFSYWASASTDYAKSVRGETRVMLNASLEKSFDESSYFGTWEVPNIDPSKVTQMTILLVHIPGQNIRSTCSSDDILTLKRILGNKNITTACEESPWVVQTMLCMDYPDVDECKREITQNVNSTLAINCLPFTLITAFFIWYMFLIY